MKKNPGRKERRKGVASAISKARRLNDQAKAIAVARDSAKSRIKELEKKGDNRTRKEDRELITMKGGVAA